MDQLAFEIAVIAIVSPFLLIAGILYLISATHIGVQAIALNALTVIVGAVRFGLDLPDTFRPVTTVLFGFFLILALVANARIVLRPRSSRSRPRGLPSVSAPAAAPVGAPQPTAVPPPAGVPSPARVADAKRVRIIAAKVWLLNNDWCDIRVFTVPPGIIERNKDLLGSTRNFRIVYNEDAEPVEEGFAISQSCEILLPPDLVDKLQSSELIRFEILD